MKKTPLSTLTACIAILGIALSANAATTFQQVTDDGAGYDIFNTDNWTNGLPTLANIGTVNLDSVWDVNTDHMTGWHLIQTAGSMTSAGAWNDNKINGGTILDLQGGNYSHSGAQQINDGASVLGSGADVYFQWTVPFYDAGVTFDVSAGTVSVRSFSANNGSNLNTINISGGTLTSSTQSATKLNGNVEFNVSGGTFTTDWMGALATATGTTYNVSGGDIVTAVYEANGKANIDFTTGSTGTFTLTGADQAAFETLYAAGSLLYNGSNAATFGDVFSVSESTVSVVPEPATMSLLALGGMAMLKRRKK